ncbi:hypothetical protein HGRIS_002337 [Hohenbuehelia grisea]|uniref:DASH complex subunit DAD2 n=1 Tax=Hohenbuehelia grisea TaxID=104357 RepID=A0ABR3JLE3_9AGAR
MIRQSIAANRATSAGGAQASAAAAATKLAEKKKEYEAVAALERISSQFVERIAGITEDCETMANAGEIHGQVLQQWPKMFEILSLFLASRASSEENTEEPASAFEGQRVVRIPIDELEQSTERSM